MPNHFRIAVGFNNDKQMYEFPGYSHYAAVNRAWAYGFMYYKQEPKIFCVEENGEIIFIHPPGATLAEYETGSW